MKTRCGITVLLVALAAMIFMTVPCAAPASVTLNSYEKQIMSLVNQKRAKRGLPKLRVNAKLVDAGRAHATEMATNKFFTHNSADGELWSARLVRYGYARDGYSFWKAGENIAWGAGIYSSPYLVVRAWMNSKAHRAVILTKTFRDIGIGAVKTDDGYGSVDGTVWFFTLDLGRRIAQ